MAAIKCKENGMHKSPLIWFRTIWSDTGGGNRNSHDNQDAAICVG
jgi:hypothetical protein